MHDVRKSRRTSVRRLDTGSISQTFLPYGSDYYPCVSAINLGFGINLDGGPFRQASGDPRGPPYAACLRLCCGRVSRAACTNGADDE